MRPCYAGPVGTLGVGTCHSGVQHCGVDRDWSAVCDDAVAPVAEVCRNGADDDCNGLVDDGCPVVVDVTLGTSFTVALLSDGTLWSWGSNYRRELGGSSSTSVHSTRVLGLTDVTQVSAGDAHTCALLRDGTVWCWGADDMHQLGAIGSGGGACGPRRWPCGAPVRVPDITGAIQVAAGMWHTCALLVGSHEHWPCISQKHSPGLTAAA